MKLLVDAVRALTTLWLKRFNLETSLLQGPCDAASNRVSLPTHRGHGVDEQVHLGRTMSPQVSV